MLESGHPERSEGPTLFCLIETIVQDRRDVNPTTAPTWSLVTLRNCSTWNNFVEFPTWYPSKP
jgi:hypothetical protein